MTLKKFFAMLILITMILSLSVFSSFDGFSESIGEIHAQAAKYKRVAPKPKGKWKLRKKLKKTVKITKKLKKSGSAAIMTYVVQALASKYGGQAIWMFGGTFFGSYFPAGNTYLTAWAYKRANKYVVQYKTVIHIYTNKSRKHIRKKASRIQSFVKKYKVVRVD